MGREAEVLAKFDGHTLNGFAHLENDVLHLRTDHRISVRFSEIEACREADGWLTIEYGIHRLDLHLGTSAAKWQKAIECPPTLLDKLGIKPGVSMAAFGFDDLSFLGESPISKEGAVDLFLLHAVTADDLRHVRPTRGRVAPRGALWIVYPRGSKTIPERMVMAEGACDGWVDVKTCRFDETRTALKFVRRR